MVTTPGQRECQPVSIMAQLSVRRGRAAVQFYKAAFGAVEDYRAGGTDQHEAVVARLGRIEDPFGHHFEIGRPLVPWPPSAHTYR